MSVTIYHVSLAQWLLVQSIPAIMLLSFITHDCAA